MVLGAILGAGMGMLTGITVGSVLFSSKDSRTFKHLDQSADTDEVSGVSPKANEVREILELSPHWTKWPDYERVGWINRMIACLWPHYNSAVADIIHETVTPILDDTCRQVKILASIEIEKVDLGKRPMKLGGIKTYETREDEVIIEAPVLWGSDANIRVSVSLQFGPLRIFIPVALKDILLHAVARITIRPLVETLPCLGALHISLLEDPYVDMTLNLINNVDFMAVPGIKEIAAGIVKSVLSSLMLYPNQFSVDLMEGGGVPPAPVGMLKVKNLQLQNLVKSDALSKTDAHCVLEVREGRPQRTTTVLNNQNPVFKDQEFHLVVDDPEEQCLKVTVKDDDYAWSANTVGVCMFKLSALDCFERPREATSLTGELWKEDEQDKKKGVLTAGSKRIKKLTSAMGATRRDVAEKKSLGTVLMEVTFLPFYRPGSDDEADLSSDDDTTQAPAMYAPRFDQMRAVSSVRDDLKGLLTITLTRCLHLAGRDTYVMFHLNDKVDRKVEIQKSTYVLNDESPRWGDKFDFVMINANSDLTVTVMEKPGFMESLIGIKLTKKSDDKGIGVIRIPVSDVARNGRLKDTWALQEVQQGEIELTLTWTTCEFAG